MKEGAKSTESADVYARNNMKFIENLDQVSDFNWFEQMISLAPLQSIGCCCEDQKFEQSIKSNVALKEIMVLRFN